MPAPEVTKTLSLSLPIWLTATATEEVATSKIASTPPWSYHRRAMAAPTSGLFWWSAKAIETLRSGAIALTS